MNTERRQRIIDEVEAAGWIQSGMTVAIGQPTPMALVRQIIRRGLKDLTIVDAGFSLDLLIAAGCARKVVSYYAGGGFGNPVGRRSGAQPNAAKAGCAVAIVRTISLE